MCLYNILYAFYLLQCAPALMQVRSLASTSGAVIELSNYLEQRISQKSADYAAVINLK